MLCLFFVLFWGFSVSYKLCDTNPNVQSLFLPFLFPQVFTISLLLIELFLFAPNVFLPILLCVALYKSPDLSSSHALTLSLSLSLYLSLIHFLHIFPSFASFHPHLGYFEPLPWDKHEMNI